MSEAAERANLKRKKEIGDIQREKVEVEEAGLLPFDRIKHRYNQDVPRTTISTLPPLTSILRCANSSQIGCGGQGVGGDDSLPRKLDHVALAAASVIFTTDETSFKIRKLLRKLVPMDGRKLWEFVNKHSVLQDIFSSYLQYRTRWYDLLQPGKNKTFLLANCNSLDASVLFLFERFFQDLRHQKYDRKFLPGLCLLEISLKNKLIDLPLLLDVCAIFGYDTDDTMASAVATDAIEVLPKLAKDVTDAANTFLSIVHSLHERCMSRLKGVVSPAEDGWRGSYQFAKECHQVLDFINDAVYTLSSFVPAYKGAAYLFCQTDAQWSQSKRLLHTLAMVYDSLLPSLLAGAKATSVPLKASDDLSRDIEDIDSGIGRLSDRVVWFAWSLMEHYYLSDYLPGSAVLDDWMNLEPPAVRVPYLIRTLGDIMKEPSKTFEYPTCAKLGGFARALLTKQDVSNEIRTFSMKASVQLRSSQESFLKQLDELRKDPELASGRTEDGDVVMGT